MKPWCVLVLLVFLVVGCAPSAPTEEGGTDGPDGQEANGEATTSEATEIAEPEPTATPLSAVAGTEILWDRSGVPHIFARNDEGIAYASGWTQTRSHGDLLLRLYAQSRGRAAEYLGEDWLESDRSVRTLGVPELGAEWYAQQSEEYRRLLDHFAAGVNDYAAQHIGQIDSRLRGVLPISGADLLAHAARAIHFTFVSHAGNLSDLWSGAGSNGWAIAPGHTEEGHAMLLSNAHLPWSDLYLLYESHLHTPDLNFYGATLVGFPAPLLGFNTNLGWTLTVNTYDGADAYALTLQDGGYLFDGTVRQFETEEQTILVRNEDGTFREEPLTIRRTVHGPVVAQPEDGTALALRIAGLDRPGMLEQWWHMAKAQNLEEFEAALQQMQFPMSNIIYADREGNIMLLFNGLIPVRSQGDWDYWRGVIPGDTSETLWTEYHPYEDLPKVVNPESGWLSNSNEPSWFATIPYPFDPKNFPPYFSPPAPDAWDFRAQRSKRMLMEDEAMTFERMVENKFSSRSELADRILDDLVEVVRGSDRDLANQAADVLEAWDHTYNADSQGALLFDRWYRTYRGMTTKPFAVPWHLDAEPLMVPEGIGDPEAAVQALETVTAELLAQAGSLDVAWGEMVRIRLGGRDLPSSGGGTVDSFRVAEPALTSDGKYQVVLGDSFIYAIAFSEPMKASALLVYGNASQPGSHHIGDQAESYARSELRPAWLTREDVEMNLERYELIR
ncbi:MAG: acylase [Chloroflexaceae bacterium]|nr:acylase [Chloroflexaceae bacterium]